MENQLKKAWLKVATIFDDYRDMYCWGLCHCVKQLDVPHEIELIMLGQLMDYGDKMGRQKGEYFYPLDLDGAKARAALARKFAEES